MAFSNQSIEPKRAKKPHIVFVSGYWRVSPSGNKFFCRWWKAHQFVYRLNTGKEAA